MNIKPRLLVALGASAALSACASNWSAKEGYFADEEFGEANRQTYAAMIVNPAPEYDEPIETSAQSTADAAERVRERRVVQPVAEDTTSVGSGGGGGGG